MKRIFIIFFSVILLAGCSKSKTESLIDEVKQLDNENSVVDVLVSNMDPLGNNAELQFSVRNDKDGFEGDLIFDVIDEIFNLEEVTTTKPEIPEYNTGLTFSAQRKEDLKLYEIQMMVDSELKYVKLFNVQSENVKVDYNKFYHLTETLKANMKEIINFKK
ncbi:lipoprotein [Paenibacillus sp. Marseille-Q7038]